LNRGRRAGLITRLHWSDGLRREGGGGLNKGRTKERYHYRGRLRMRRPVAVVSNRGGNSPASEKNLRMLII